MLRQLAGQISVRHCSSEVRNTRSRLFRPVQGPHTVVSLVSAQISISFVPSLLQSHDAKSAVLLFLFGLRKLYLPDINF